MIAIERTLKDLVAILREFAGEEEPGRLDGAILDVSFADLDYDSVSVLEVTGVIERRYGIQLADEAASEAETPRVLLEMVNTALAAIAA
jgi:act minimal PKS acyl carrier protein